MLMMLAEVIATDARTAERRIRTIYLGGQGHGRKTPTPGRVLSRPLV